ncbi:MAG: hypothetical protein WA152_01155 [Microgenomates group bacterium]
MKEIEIEYRVETPFNEFDSIYKKINSVASLKSHKSRFSLMVFLSKNDEKSILYLRTTKDYLTNETDVEIVHKKGAQHAHDRIELTQKIDSKDFENFLHLFATITADKILVMQRETFNFEGKDGVIISLVKSRNHSYIEFEKLSSTEESDSSSKTILDLIDSLGLSPLDKDGSERLFKELDINDDIILTGSIQDSEKATGLYKQFINNS